MSRELHPEGFRVLDRPVSTSFANPSSFQPLAPHSLRDEGCVMGSTSLGGTEGVFAKYWDESTVVLEMAFEVKPTESGAKKEATSGPDKKKKKKNKEEDSCELFHHHCAAVSSGFQWYLSTSTSSWLQQSSRKRRSPRLYRQTSNH